MTSTYFILIYFSNFVVPLALTMYLFQISMSLWYNIKQNSVFITNIQDQEAFGPSTIAILNFSVPAFDIEI